MWEQIWGQFVWGGGAAVPLLGPIGLAALAVSFLAGGYLLRVRRSGWRSALTVGGLLCVLPLIALAGSLSVPFVFNNGQVADANEVNQNFAVLAGAIPTGSSCPAGSVVTGFDLAGDLLCTAGGPTIIGDFVPSTSVPLPHPGTGAWGARTVVRSISVPAGDYLVVAMGTLLDMNKVSAFCDLTAFRDSDGFEFTLGSANTTYSVLGTGVSGGFNTPAPLAGQLPSSITPATVEYACKVGSGVDASPRNIDGTSLHAISAIASSEQ